MRAASISEYAGLYAQGYTVTEIARMLGKAKSTVSMGLKNYRVRPQEPKSGEICPHSPSCFTCPMGDCVADAKYAYRYNII